MPQTLQYASPTTRVARPLWQQVVLVPLYYLGWMIGGGVASSYGTAITMSQWRSTGLDGSYVALVVSGVAGALGGAALASILSRRRRPQVTLAVLGGGATAYFGYAVVDLYRSPPGFVSLFFLIVGLVLLSGAVGMLMGGVSGIVLTRRR